jgi:pyruvate/2-oxoglutarate dehydrogenase complex dihydrolipoamide dehydrogenase (E3) component
LIAVGREPNVGSLNLEAAGVDYSAKDGIYADKYLATSNQHIYSIGDCLASATSKAEAEILPGSGPQFTHNSDVHARTVVKNALLFGQIDRTMTLLPQTTYTDPEISRVGFSSRELKAKGIEFDTFTKFYERLDRAHCEGKSGMMKILTEKGSDKILGAVVVGGPAGELIMTLTSGMHNGLGLGQIGACVYPYPSWAEGIKHLSD